MTSALSSRFVLLFPAFPRFLHVGERTIQQDNMRKLLHLLLCPSTFVPQNLPELVPSQKQFHYPNAVYCSLAHLVLLAVPAGADDAEKTIWTVCPVDHDDGSVVPRTTFFRLVHWY
jgi:hypothetical protein